MKNYIEVKIKKKYIAIVGIVLTLGCSLGGYYLWSQYNPQIHIYVGESSAGENLKVEAPHVSIISTGIASPADSIQLKLNNIVMQHEFFCMYLREAYKTSDIKLEMKVEKNKTILRYYGTATTLSNKTTEIEKEIVLDFVIKADITSDA